MAAINTFFRSLVKTSPILRPIDISSFFKSIEKSKLANSVETSLAQLRHAIKRTLAPRKASPQKTSNPVSEPIDVAESTTSTSKQHLPIEIQMRIESALPVKAQQAFEMLATFHGNTKDLIEAFGKSEAAYEMVELIDTYYSVLREEIAFVRSTACKYGGECPAFTDRKWTYIIIIGMDHNDINSSLEQIVSEVKAQRMVMVELSASL